MFWPVMFEAASNVGPEGPLKKCLYLCWKSQGTQPAHTPTQQARKHSRQQTADSPYTKRPFIAWDPDSVESDGFLGSGEGEDDPDSEESDFE